MTNSPEQSKTVIKQSGRTTQVSTPKPTMATLRQKKTGNTGSKVVKIAKDVAQVPAKMTAKQKKLSTGSETLQIGKKQSSNKSTGNSSTPKQTAQAVKPSRKKAQDKQAFKVKKVLRKESITTESEGVVSPEFGGRKKKEGSGNKVGRPKLQL